MIASKMKLDKNSFYTLTYEKSHQSYAGQLSLETFREGVEISLPNNQLLIQSKATF